MKRARSTLLLLVVGAALGAYIYFVESKRTPANELTSKKEKVFALEADTIQSIEIASSKGEKTSLEKEGDTWKVVAPAASAADSTELTSITSSLASLEIQRTVEENASNLEPYGLSPPAIEVVFKAEGMSDARRLLFGKKNPTGSDLYAKTSDSPKVFLVSGFLDTTFDRGTFDLRDKGVLKFERNAVSALDIAIDGQAPIQMTKNESDWRLKAPWQSRGDYGSIEGVVGRISSAQMKAIVSGTSGDLKTFGLDKPAVRVTLGAGSAQATLLIGGSAENSTLYAKDAARDEIFTVDQSLVDELKKTPDTYRPKDVFEFRTFTGDRVEVARGTSRTVFERIKGDGENATEKWMQTEPKLEIAEGKIEDFLSKISNLRADGFVDALPASREEIAVITTRFGAEKKEEKATFYKAGTDIFATRAEDAGAAKLTGTAFGEAMAALDQVKPAESTEEKK